MIHSLRISQFLLCTDLMTPCVKVSVAGVPSIHRSEETTTWKLILSHSSRPDRLRPGFSGTASNLNLNLNKPINRSSKPPTQQPMTIGTSRPTASRTSTGSTSTPGRSRRVYTEGDKEWKALSIVGLFWLHRDRICAQQHVQSVQAEMYTVYISCTYTVIKTTPPSCETQEKNVK